MALDPPKLIESPGHLETKRVAFTGSSILLPCLVDKSNDDLFIDWTKDGDSITNIDARIKQTNSGSLKLRELLPDDTGFYLCKAVNGFGSVEIGINLIVLGKYYFDRKNLELYFVVSWNSSFQLLPSKDPKI